MERPESSSETSGMAGHEHDLREEVRQLAGRCDQLERMLHQRNAAYDTLIRAGAAGQRRALGLEPQRPAPRRGRASLSAVTGTA